MQEAKQFYPFFGLGANVALIFSGQAVRHFSNVRATLPAGVDGWEVSLRGMMGLVVAFGLLICALRYYLQVRPHLLAVSVLSLQKPARHLHVPVEAECAGTQRL